MLTINQITTRKKRIIAKKKQKRLPLANCPQKRGTCIKVYTLTPRKPCSARRTVTRVKLSNKKIVACHIPGHRHNLKKYSTVLVRGGPPNDLPGVNYRVIRAAKRTDLYPVFERKKARSKYGVKNIFRLHRIRFFRGKGEKISGYRV